MTNAKKLEQLLKLISYLPSLLVSLDFETGIFAKILSQKISFASMTTQKMPSPT